MEESGEENERERVKTGLNHHTLLSLGRGVPGVELAADPGRDADELTRIRRPSLSNLGGTPGSDDQDRFRGEGRDRGD